MKEGIRILGVDDAAHNRKDEQSFLTGVVYRGTEFIEAIETVPVKVDSYEATEKLIDLFDQLDNQIQIKAILTDGISFAGFNIKDIEKVSRETGKPVIAVTSNRPRKKEFRRAMKESGNYDDRFEKLDDYEEVELDDGLAYIQFSGIDLPEAKAIVRKSTTNGLTPEAVRVAHLIGGAFKED